MTNELNTLVGSILKGEISLNSLSKQELIDVQHVMELVKAKFVSPEQQKKNKAKAIRQGNFDAAMEADIDLPSPDSAQPKPKPKASHLKVVKQDGMPGSAPAGGHVIKFDKNGQWKMDKAIKPGPALDYSTMNPKPDHDKIEREAPTIDYSNPQKSPAAKPPKSWVGARDKRDAALASAGMSPMKRK